MLTHSRFNGDMRCGGIVTRRNSFFSAVPSCDAGRGWKFEDDAGASPGAAEAAVLEPEAAPAWVEEMRTSSSSSSTSMDAAEVDAMGRLGGCETRVKAGCSSSCD